jgi:hypothetical protein
MLVTSLQSLVLTATLLAGLSFLGYPIKQLVEQYGNDFPAPAAVPGMALLFVVSWYWLDLGGHGLVVPTVACLGFAAAYAIVDLKRRRRAVFEFDAHRVKLCAASLLIAGLLILLNWSSVLSLPYITTATTGNNDAVSYVVSAQHLADHGFDAPGPVAGRDLGQGARQEAFSSYALIGSFGAVTTLGAWKVANTALFAMVALATYTLALTVDALMARRRWLFSSLVAGSATATFFFVYVQVRWFFGQLVAMAVAPLIAVAALRLRSATRRSEMVAPVVVAVAVSLILMSHYAHMAIPASSIFAVAALATAFSAASTWRTSLRATIRVGEILAGCFVLAWVLVPAWLINGIRLAQHFDTVDAGWKLPGFVPVELLGFIRTETPRPSASRWIWSAAVIGIFILGAWSLRKREAVISRFGAAVVVLILASYGAVLLREGAPSYQQWKWITFFQPVFVAVIVATVALALERLLSRIRWNVVAPATALVFGLVVSTNAGAAPATGLRDRRQLLYASVDHWLLSQSPDLRSLSEVNVNVAPFWDTMWAVYFLRDKTLYLQQPSYYPLSKPTARWTLVPATGSLSGESVISISDKFRLLEQPASPALNDPKAGLHSSVNVTVGQDAGGMVRGHATIVNDGLSKWLPSESTGGVILGVQLEDEIGKLVDRDWKRIPIVAGRLFSIPPGTIVDLDFQLPPLTPGKYQLVFDLLSEGVGWFENPVTVPITIDSPRGG